MAAFRSILVPLGWLRTGRELHWPRPDKSRVGHGSASGGRNPRASSCQWAVSPMVLLAADPYLSHDEMARMSADEAHVYLGHASRPGLSIDGPPIAAETYIINGSPAEAIVQFATGKWCQI